VKLYNYLSLFIGIIILQTARATDSLSVDNNKKFKLKNPLEYIEFRKGRFSAAVYPVCSYDPASGLELGIMPTFSISPRDTSAGNKFYRASSIVNHLTYSTNNWINIRSDAQFFSSKGYCNKFFFQYLNSPDYFYGIGNDTLNSSPDSFHNQYFKFAAESQKLFNDVHYVGLKIDFYTALIKAGNDTHILSDSIEGFSGGTMFGIGPVYRIDSRDNVNFPGKGIYTELSACYFPAFADDKNGVFNYTLDFRKYFELFKSYYFAYQANLNSITGDVPFYRLSTIGGKYNLRGISNKFMYIDNNAWYTQAEIRKMIIWRFGAVAFAGIGNTFSVWDDSIFKNVKTIFGIGGRFQLIPKDKLNLRFDYAFGPNGDRGFYATVREIF